MKKIGKSIPGRRNSMCKGIEGAERVKGKDPGCRIFPSSLDIFFCHTILNSDFEFNLSFKRFKCGDLQLSLNYCNELPW